jgi:hypothetical protein
VANASGSSVVSSCRVSGELLGQSTLGAVVAYISNSEVNLCSAYADVHGDERVGGLVGSANYSEISQSYTDGKVRGSLRIGGLVGYLNTGSVYDSYSHSETIGTSNVGGLIGRVYASSSRVLRCYSTGLVQGITDTHGMVGSTTSGNDMYDANYFNTTTSNQSICPAAQGRTSEQMTYPYQYTFSSYDFVSIWDADEDQSYNSGYPYLRGSEPYVPPLPGIKPEITQLNQSTLRISWEAIPNAGIYRVFYAELPLAIDNEAWLEIGTSADLYYDYVVPAGQSQGFFLVKAGE